MTRKKCKRTVYPLLNSLAHGLAGAAISDKESLDKLRLCELSALDAMIYGRATVEDWRWLTDVLNIAETMGKSGIGPEVLPYCIEAQKALYDAAKRYESTKVMGLSGVGIGAIRDVWEFHDLQRTSIPRSKYEAMIQKTINTIKSRSKDVMEIA